MNIKNIFLEDDKDQYNINDDVNIVLSPYFYWIKIIETPIKKIDDIIKISKNFFDEIDDIDNYQFIVNKIDSDQYYVVALNIDSIKEKIKNIGFKLNRIKSIHIAQFELIGFTPFKTSKWAYYTNDDILISVPLAFYKNINSELAEIDSDYFDSVKLSNIVVNFFKNNNNNADNKTKIYLYLILIVSIFDITLTYFNYYSINKKNDSFFNQHAMKNSTIQNISLISDIEQKLKDETKKSNALKKIFDTDITGGYIDEITSQKDRFNFHIKTEDEKNKSDIAQKLILNGFPTIIDETGISVEAKYE